MSRGEVPGSIDTSTGSAASASGRFSHHAVAPAAATAATSMNISSARKAFIGVARCAGKAPAETPR